MCVVLGIRAESSASPSVLAVETTSSTSSDAPFFTSGSIGGHPADPGSNAGEPSNVAKTALEWVFAIIVLIAIASVTTWRYVQLRRRNQSILSFFPRPQPRRSESRDQILNTRERRRSLPHTTGLPRPCTLSGASTPVTATLFYPPSLSHGRYPEPLEPVPAHLAHSVSLSATERGRQSRRAARGADIDAQGRRGGRPDLDDWEGDDKDELPAYESVAVGGPPRYADMDVQYVGGVPLRVLTLPMTIPESSPESASAERVSRRDESMDRSCSPSPNLSQGPELSTTSNSPAPAPTNDNPSCVGPESNPGRSPTLTSPPSNFHPC